MAVFAACALAGLVAAGAVAAPPLQPVSIIAEIELELPEGVIWSTEARGGGANAGGASAPELAPDEEHIFTVVEVDGASQIALFTLDGRWVDCLTCGFVEMATKPDVLDDEKRLWFGQNVPLTPGVDGVPLPGRGGTGDFQWHVLECEPSIYQCDEAEVLDVEFPIDSLVEGAQNREASPDAFGEFVVWNEVRSTEGTRVTLAKLMRRESDYVLVEPRVITPHFSLSPDVGDWIHGARFYEGGTFWDGNRTIKYQRTTSALNYDIVTFDLATGEHSQLSTDLDYNEIGTFSPDGELVWASSARGLDRMDVFTQLVRPPLIDFASFGQVGRVALWNNRRCMNEGWIWDRAHGQRLGGYSGQPFLLTDNWNLRRWDWFSDSRRGLVFEQRIPNEPDPADPAKRARIRIVELPAKEASEPKPTRHVDEYAWRRTTTPADEYTGMGSRQVLARPLAGRHSGTATVTYSGLFAAGAWRVEYRNYSDDGRSFVNGTESLSTPNPVVEATWDADLTISGEQEGFLRGTIHVGPQQTYSGDVASEINGRRLEGIPTQADCPGLFQPSLDAKLVRAGRPGTDLLVEVTVRVPEDSEPRPVTHALVVASSGQRKVSGRTGDDGKVALRLPAGGPVWEVGARAESFKPSPVSLFRPVVAK